MSPRNTLARVIEVWALCGGALLLLIVAGTAINASGFAANMLARSWGGSVPGLSGYEDAVTLLIGVAALAMFPYAQLHGSHAAIDVFMQKAPGWANRGVTLLSGVLVAALALGMAVMLSFGALELRGDAVETAVLGWPVWIFLLPAIPSCGLWALAALAEIFTGTGDF